ncbi:hypothetical protein HDU79_011030 [Rhizoclosmatium sp. JEL0117]|nr:hypothetical protein HDU79_011030 [Rhizoclosmatium sp. JEL0117]
MIRDAENTDVINHQLSAIKTQTDRSLLNALKSSRNTIAKLDIANSHAAYTLNALAEQREKLERARDSIQKIDQTVHVADTKVDELHRLKGWLPRIKIKFPKLFKKKKNATAETPSDSFADEITPHAEALESMASDVTLISRDEPTLIGNVCAREAAAREMDSHLDRISSSLAVLKMASMAMGDEIDAQNTCLEGLGQDTDRVRDSITFTNGKLKTFK